MTKPINKRQWFDVSDSLTTREDGKGEYCNVEARFADHPVLNPEKSRIKRANVYDIGIVLLTRVKRGPGDVKAQPNMSSQVLRFDKGERQGAENFISAKKAIDRCRPAWDHYQLFRKSPVTDTERLALRQVEAEPETPTGVLVDVEGELVRMDFDEDADDRDDDNGPDVAEAAVPARFTKTRKTQRKTG